MIVTVSDKYADDREIANGYVKVGKYYRVQALFVGDSEAYMLYEPSVSSIPLPFKQEMFTIIDSRLSRYWHYSPRIMPTQSSMGRTPLLAPKEWCERVGFYEDLVEDRNGAFEVWKGYQEKMELEFSDNSIDLLSSIIDSAGWVNCAVCDNIFMANASGELNKCTECGVVQKNPFVP